MTVEKPDHYGGKPIPDDAIEIALAAEKKKKGEEAQGKAQGEAPPLDGFIYIPSIKLYFAKEISHLGEEWYDTHIELQSKGLKMPTLPQFIEFLKYLRADPTAENTRVYDEITEVGSPRRIDWLDANFYAKGDESWVAYNHIVDSNGKLVAQENEKLEGHLMQDEAQGISLEYWLNNPTKQGLPQENPEQGDLVYMHPRDRGVAWFYADPDGAGLDCDVDPDYSAPGHGVRAVRTRTQKSGGKQ